MTRRCTVCSHPDRDLVDLEIVGRAVYRRIATVHGLTEASIRRHAAAHIPATMALAAGAAEVSRADVLLAQCEALRLESLELLDQAPRTRETSAPRCRLSGRPAECSNFSHAWPVRCQT